MAPGTILDSWKAVASYLNHSIRTCQRLEREAGLPIHRVDDTPKARIYATTEELDQWLSKTRHQHPRSARRKLLTRAAVVAGHAVLLTMVLVVLRTGWLKRGAGAPARPSISLAVLPLLNDTGDAGLDAIGGRLQRRIIAEIRAGSEERVAVVNAPAVAETLEALGASGLADLSESLIRSVMKRTEATHLFIGHFWKDQAGWTLSYDLFGPQGRSASASLKTDADPLALAPLAAGRLFLDLGAPAHRDLAGREPARLKAAGEEPGPFLEAAQSAERSSVSEFFDPEQLQQAIALYRRAIAVRPASAPAYFGLGHCYQTQYYVCGTLDRTIFEAMAAAYREALRLDPELPEALIGVGWTNLLGGDVDGAYAQFKKARDLAPEEPEVNYHVGAFLGQVGLADRAVFFLTRAVDLGDRSTRSYRMRAYYEMLAGQFGAAERDAARLCEMNPTNAKMFAMHAQALLWLGDLEGARRKLGVAAVLAAEDTDVRLTQAVIWAAEGEKDKALGILRDLGGRVPLPELYSTAVHAFLCLFEEALAEIRSGIERGRRTLHRIDYPFPLLADPPGPVCGGLRDHPGYRRIVQELERERDGLRKKYGGL
ncbi:MAG TPA: tetratricopeptide repeat protein [Candidatus Aminicenantes bacterium]|nr:tetratricopeptide repeat protein [Candidatus Aminicenantes bacterium]HRY65548.1 tetratricopeptide repeat protein [Candidatus Aminicenantes bacterium]HRZ72564.1 tetratricopeptide repeat protein [Candidatus Aminicenantes bacterium]